MRFQKAKPSDILLVYLAGHGTSINKGGDIGDTYLYLTKEAVTASKSRLMDEKLRASTTISSEELADWIREVPALKRAMILDTCAAGAVEASLVKPRDLSPDRALHKGANGIDGARLECRFGRSVEKRFRNSPQRR